MYYFKNLIKTLDFIKIKTIIFLNNKTFIKIIKIKMDDIKKILLEKKQEINISLDSFINDVKKNIDNKNKKIQELANKPKIFIFYDIESLRDCKKNNTLFKLFLKNILKLKKDNKKLKKAISDNSNKSTINTKDMSAFRLIALELEEKEKILKENSISIIEKDEKITTLEKEITLLNNTLNKTKEEINVLTLNNKELNRINDLQLQTITKLENEIKDKVNSVGELKESFLKLMEKYNDILLEVY